MFAQWCVDVLLKVLSSFNFWCRGQDAASKPHHSANTNVVCHNSRTMKCWTILTLITFISCGQRNKISTTDRDMVKRDFHSKYSVDKNSMDTLFFDDFNGSIEGVLPDTSTYFGFIYYKVGDSLYPFLTTIDKKGQIIDRQSIGIGACGGLAIDVDSCVDKVSINEKLEIDMFYKMRGTADTNDSIPQTVKICNWISGKGKITKDGKIEIRKGELEVCDVI